MLTLYTTPVVYLYLDRFSLWTRRLRQRRSDGKSAAAADDEDVATMRKLPIHVASSPR
jgi:hypothetical protein